MKRSSQDEEDVSLQGLNKKQKADQKLSIEVLRKLPKAELHRHLDGSVRVSTIIELAKEQNIELPTFDEKELTKLVSVDNDCTSLEEYLRGFAITLKVLQRPDALTRVMYEGMMIF